MEKDPKTEVTAVTLPMQPLVNICVFPNTIIHYDAVRKKSVRALETAMLGDRRVFVCMQIRQEMDDPDRDNLHSIGTIVKIKQLLKMPNDAVRVLVEGICRARLLNIEGTDPYYTATVLEEYDEPVDEEEQAAELRVCREEFQHYAHHANLSKETQDAMLRIQDCGRLADSIASNILSSLEDKQEILSQLNPVKRIETLSGILHRETEIRSLEGEIRSRVKQQIEKSQREYYLHEQIRVIQEELGDKQATDTEDLEKTLRELPLNEEAREKTDKELERLRMLNPASPEVSVSRTYLETIASLPWGVYTQDEIDSDRTRAILDEDHYGLDKVKDRIVEYLAVRALTQSMKGPILCFVGPPGTGKTSIARSIARALGRKFVRMSLGGVHDEAEIRGHRRTYIGAIPGNIISSIKQAGSMNPVMLFDEIDKMSSDFRGDPASAMLEVLDSEQNSTFRDHYLDIPFDLSRVLFIMTANTMDTIPRPLMDRMEIIEVTGYTDEEKTQIVKRHILPKQIKENGLKPGFLKMEEDTIKDMINYYTRESGVREIERVIGALCRKTAILALKGRRSVKVQSKDLVKYLGKHRFHYDLAQTAPEIGVVNGLAYTTVGGVTLQVEALPVSGNGALLLTGSLGDVMKESANAGVTYIRAHAEELGIEKDFHSHTDVHVHVPEGATPKDGPSAGITIATAVVSALAKKPVKQDIAMTGEITLRGRVLPIGGLKEKSLAAYRAGMKMVLFPKDNEPDLEDIPATVRKKMKFVPVSTLDEVLSHVLVG
ncbi:MAG: endopeptidase La [Clostridia bacterium]|nr:endopeptidase La [Clostridia bacterium]